jgi:hypothetical protein
VTYLQEDHTHPSGWVFLLINPPFRVTIIVLGGVVKLTHLVLIFTYGPYA